MIVDMVGSSIPSGRELRRSPWRALRHGLRQLWAVVVCRVVRPFGDSVSAVSPELSGRPLVILRPRRLPQLRLLSRTASPEVLRLLWHRGMHSLRQPCLWHLSGVRQRHFLHAVHGQLSLPNSSARARDQRASRLAASSLGAGREVRGGGAPSGSSPYLACIKYYDEQPTNSFLSRPAWAPANGLVSIAAATSYPTKLSMLSLVLIAPHRCIIIVSALIC